MTSTMEQWCLIFYVIVPIGFYCMLGLIEFVDSKRGSDVTSNEKEEYADGFYLEQDDIDDYYGENDV